MPYRIHTVIEINAPADRIWTVLTDMNEYQRCNRARVIRGFNAMNAALKVEAERASERAGDQTGAAQ